jgi:hypothetical protein
MKQGEADNPHNKAPETTLPPYLPFAPPGKSVAHEEECEKE